MSSANLDTPHVFLALLAALVLTAFLGVLDKKGRSCPIPPGYHAKFKRGFRICCFLAAVALFVGALFSAVFFSVNLLTGLTAFLESSAERHSFRASLPFTLPEVDSLQWGGAFVPYCIDRSAVTPAILVLCSFVAALKLVEIAVAGGEKGKGVPINKSFPVFDGYERTLVQLGLLGTLFAFLLVGGQMGEMSRERQVQSQALVKALEQDDAEHDDSFLDEAEDAPQETSDRSSRAGIESATQILLTAFSTALVSTFVAVLFAFVILPILVRFSGLALRYGLTTPVIADPEESIDVLTRLATALNETAQKAEIVGDRIGSMAETVDSAEDRLKGFSTAAQTSHASLDDLRGKAQVCGDELKRVAGGGSDVISRFSTLASGAKNVSSDLERFRAQATLAESAQRDLVARTRETSSTLEHLGKAGDGADKSLGAMKDKTDSTGESLAELSKKIGLFAAAMEWREFLKSMEAAARQAQGDLAMRLSSHDENVLGKLSSNQQALKQILLSSQGRSSVAAAVRPGWSLGKRGISLEWLKGLLQALKKPRR